MDIRYLYISTILFSLMFAGCGYVKNSDPQPVLDEFMSAWKNEDVEKMISIYPDVSVMEIFYASDTAFIENIYQLNEGSFRAKVVNTYKNEKGKEEKKNLIFILKKQGKNNGKSFLISDSYGFCCWSQYPYYTFANNTGCIPKSKNLSDKELYDQMVIARDLLFDTAKKLYLNLTDNIIIESTNISKHNNDTIKGYAEITNKSDYNLPELKYVIYFFDNNHKQIGTDSGWITKTNFDSGKKMRFSFITTKARGAKDASFEIDFDLALILDFVINDNGYSGAEYDEFVRILKQERDIV